MINYTIRLFIMADNDVYFYADPVHMTAEKMETFGVPERVNEYADSLMHSGGYDGYFVTID